MTAVRLSDDNAKCVSTSRLNIYCAVHAERTCAQYTDKLIRFCAVLEQLKLVTDTTKELARWVGCGFALVLHPGFE